MYVQYLLYLYESGGGGVWRGESMKTLKELIYLVGVGLPLLGLWVVAMVWAIRVAEKSRRRPL